MIKVTIDTTEWERAAARIPSALNSALQDTIEQTAATIVAHAQATTSFKDQTGALRASIRSLPVTSTGDRLVGQVVAGGQSAPHAIFVHEGTRPHKIEAKNKSALRMAVGTGYLFAKSVNHPGTQARPFMTEAATAAESNIGRVAEANTTSRLRAINV